GGGGGSLPDRRGGAGGAKGGRPPPADGACAQPICVAMRRCSLVGGLNVQPRTPRPPTSPAPGPARNLPPHRRLPAGRRGLLLAQEPSLEAAARRRVLAGELDRGDVAVGQ